ncbi:hypothetical protein K439DRAFT_1631892 [Ramaria rubella]|nr:hypothetical protein K439DRAFT_1631892 [Ramaria rubella]
MTLPRQLFMGLAMFCPNLAELHLDISQGEDESFDSEIEDLPLWELSHLLRVSRSITHSHTHTIAPPAAYPPRMVNMLINRCPNLQYFHMKYKGLNYIRVSEIFELGNWPHLIRFTAEGDLYLSDEAGIEGEVIERFLERHSKLECLRLDGDLGLINIRAKAIPLLRSLSVGHSAFPRTLSMDVVKHIQFLAYVNLDDHRQLDERLFLLAQMSSLRCLSVSCGKVGTLKGVITSVPQLEKLNFHYQRPWYTEDDPESSVSPCYENCPQG